MHYTLNKSAEQHSSFASKDANRNEALAADDNQWAEQLADPLLAIDKDNAAAKKIKADALTKLAGKMVNATARNYYLTVARELRETTKPE